MPNALRQPLRSLSGEAPADPSSLLFQRRLDCEEEGRIGSGACGGDGPSENPF